MYEKERRNDMSMSGIGGLDLNKILQQAKPNDPVANRAARGDVQNLDASGANNPSNIQGSQMQQFLKDVDFSKIKLQ